jgi:hypothetical protein
VLIPVTISVAAVSIARIETGPVVVARSAPAQTPAESSQLDVAQ